ncbi:MAG: lysine--tRNA ligase [Clostridia bacterium]|nr:lysine--tRNA ligase [Clostridia bacterium]
MDNLEQQELNEAIRIRSDKLRALVEEGADPFEQVRYDKDCDAATIKSGYPANDGAQVVIAGRLTAKRVMGKASFARLTDGSGNIQLYVSRDDLDEAQYAAFKKCDIGDIYGVKGKIFATKTGEISVHVSDMTLLAKSLIPLPEKFHGLKDTDTRYRQRYVDLIANPEVKDVFIKRSLIIRAIRNFLDSEGFLEVETPILNTIPGGASARPFITHHNTLDIDMYMRIAPELFLKRLIVGGFEKVYEVGRLFRNEGMDTKHNPEFTTVELYQAYADYTDMMDITERMFKHIADNVLGSRNLSYQGVEINLDTAWKRITMADAVKEYTGIDFSDSDIDALCAKAKAQGVELPKEITWGRLLYSVFDQKVEEKLIAPTFVLDYPIEVSPLAKKKACDKRLTERFEFFILGREMGNAFSELNDPIDQRERFMAQVRDRLNGDDEAQMMDEDYVNALMYGLPPTGGLGIGIDRLVMFFTDQSNIRDVLLFPTMKPLKKE